MSALTERRVEIAEVTLHIGLDTFRPIASAAVESHVIHTEAYAVPPATVTKVKECRERGGRVVAVGTTVTRTLETVEAGGGLITDGRGETSLYITPGYEFAVVDALITNYHLPRTTLLVLLEAFMGPDWRGVYRAALERGYRFGSFGDAMYTVRAR
jgi:S-adenosylmethionine:tRNA ribosyltransferase-isomerase